MQRPRDGQIYKTASGQRLGKHVPAANRHERNNRRDVIRKGQCKLRLSSVRQSVKRGLEPEAEE
jgi:hypothetical protein